MTSNLLSKSAIMQEVACPIDREGNPLVFRKGKGAKLYSDAGQEYIDLQNSKGSVLLGHSCPQITEAICSLLEKGEDVRTGYHPLIYEVAGKLTQQLGQKAIAFFKTGTAAVKAAAQAMICEMKKPIILSAGYHGYDSFWHAASNLYEPNLYGVVDFYYDLTLLERMIDDYQGKIATVIISPDVLYFGRDWYERVQQIVTFHQLKLICDEVKVGYRYRPGLMVEQFGWKPDLAIVSKGIANGFPLAAVVGSEEILRHLKNSAYTSFFDPLSFAAAKITLNVVETGEVQANLERIGTNIAERLKKILKFRACPVEVIHHGSLFQLVFGDKEFESCFYEIALKEGIVFYVKDSQALSLAFDEGITDELFARLDQTFQKLEEEFDMDSLLSPKINDYYDAAWNLVDGLPDMKLSFVDVEKQLLRLKRG